MIYYVGFYGREGDPSRRLASQAAVDKMNYIASKLSVYDEVTIVSASQTTRCGKVYFDNRTRLDQHVYLQTFLSIGWPMPMLARCELIMKQFQIFLYLLIHCSRKSNVVVYHSLYTMNTIKLAHRLCRFNLVLEVEEIYQDVVDIPLQQQELEFQAFEDANAFIFSTEYLNQKLNQNQKKHCIVYGNYRVCVDRKQVSDGLIHVVFGGNLERSKGALQATKAAALLPEGFLTHIAGSGPERDIQEIKQIAEAANQAGVEKIRFEGALSADDYERLLGICAIGLCSQDPDAKYSETSFPSKVLNYLRHGLRVVSIRIPTILHSAIAPAITFYQEDTANSLAEAIILGAGQEPHGVQLLENLDLRFKQDLNDVLIGGKTK